MKILSLAEVKANFSGLAQQVERGVTVVVTRHGKPVLEMRPAQPYSPDEAVELIRGFRDRPGFNRSAKPLEPGETYRDFAHRGHKR